MLIKQALLVFAAFCVLATIGEYAAWSSGWYKFEGYQEESHAGAVQLAAAALDEGTATLAELEDVFGYPVSRVSADEVPEGVAEELDGHHPVYRYRSGAEVLYFEDSQGVVRLGPLPEFIGAFSWRAAAFFGVAGIVLALLLWLLLRPFARDLVALEHAVLTYASGDRSARSPDANTADAQPLVDAFNQLAKENDEAIESRLFLIQTLAHELRTPVGRARFAGELLVDAEGNREGLAEDLQRALDDVDSLILELADFSRLDRPPDQSDYAEVELEELIQAIARDNSTKEVEVLVEAPAGSVVLPVLDVQRAVGNLVRNATEHATSRVTIEVSLDGDSIGFSVSDDGPGVPEEMAESVFEPFSRAAPGEPNRGLGLAIVAGIAARHGGSVSHGRAAIGGALFRLALATNERVLEG